MNIFIGFEYLNSYHSYPHTKHNTTASPVLQIMAEAAPAAPQTEENKTLYQIKLAEWQEELQEYRAELLTRTRDAPPPVCTPADSSMPG
jgi:hypothetical protein